MLRVIGPNPELGLIEAQFLHPTIDFDHTRMLKTS